MRIAQISDLHFTRLTWNPARLFSKRLLANLNWLFYRKNNFSEQQIADLPSLFDELKVDLVLLGGDFSTTSLLEEFDLARQFLSQLKQKWIAIPGNHDNYTYRSDRQKHFYRYFANSPQLLNLKDHKIEAHRLTPNLWLIALDTTLATNPYSSQGLFSEKMEQSLKELLALIPQDHSILLFNHYPFFPTENFRHSLQRNTALRTLIQSDPRIRLYLHGHTHRNIIADLQNSNLPIVLDAGSCAQGQKGSWNLIDLTPTGCKVTPYRYQTRWQPHPTEEFAWTRR
jgi:3',5'-cyclic AMP phosphodiesterase CpdA